MNKQVGYTYSKTCTWIGAGEGCDTASVEGSSYCSHHWPRIYREGSALRTRHRDRRVADSVWDIESAFNEAVAELAAEGEPV